MSKDNAPLRPEWSHRVEAAKIGPRPMNLSLTATAEEGKDLARRLRVLALDGPTASLTAEREPGSHIIRIAGRVSARVTQACVTTGKPVIADVSEEFESWYADPAEAVSFARVRRERLNRGEREMEMLPERDDPETVTDGFIDVAELAVQYLSLGINPYPQAPDVAVPATVEAAAPGGAARRNPFAALKDWKSRQGGEK